MKTEDIDKKIGMPDIDTEWAKFEREVIEHENRINAHRTKRGMIWKIAASVAIILCCSGALIAGVSHFRTSRADQKFEPEDTTPMVRIFIPKDGNNYVSERRGKALHGAILKDVERAIRELPAHGILSIEAEKGVLLYRRREVFEAARKNGHPNYEYKENATLNLMPASNPEVGNPLVREISSNDDEYPAEAKAAKVRACVIVSYTVDKHGWVKDPVIQRCFAGSHFLYPPITDERIWDYVNGFDKLPDEHKTAYFKGVKALMDKAVEIVNGITRWKPAKENGEPMESECTALINFYIKE